MKLTGKQIKQLHDAMLGAFTQGELSMMVATELDENLDAIAGGNNLSEIVFNLIRWAERRGRTQELVQGAVNANPQDEALLAVQRTLYGDAPAIATPPQDPTSPPPEAPPATKTTPNPYAFTYSAQQLGGLSVTAMVRLNPVHTAILHLLRQADHPLVTVALTNQTTKHLRLRVSAQVEGYSRTAVRTAPLMPGASATVDLLPAFDDEAIAAVNELTGADVRIQIENLADGSRWVDETLPLQLLALNTERSSSPRF